MKKKYLICVASFCLFVLGIAPFLWGALYTIPGIDDLSVAADIRNFGDEYITRAYNKATDLYFSWQGTYFTNILIGLIKPYDSFGVIGLRIYTFCIILVFVLSIILIINILLKCIGGSETIKYAIIIGLVLVFVVMNVNRHVEFFYFNIVIHAYTAPFVLGGLSLAYIIRCSITKKYGTKFFIGLLLGILACGGILQVSAIMSYIALVLASKTYFNSKRIKTKESVFFAFMFVFSCVNTFAPGNFNRAESGVFSFGNIIKALINACYVTVLEIRHIVMETYFPFYAVLFFVLLYYLGLEHNVKLKITPIIILIHTVLISIVATFPVVLGHNSTYMENRNTTILDFEIIIGALLAVYALYNHIIKVLEEKQLKNNMHIVLLVAILGMICFNQNYDFTDQPSLETFHQLANGKVQQYSKDMDVVLKYLDDSSGDVEVPHVHCEQGVIYKLEFQEIPEYWVNEGTAEYFELSSIRLNNDLEVNDLRQMGY